MRKALASVLVFLVFCCSVSAVPESAVYAIEGVYDGVISAMASHLSVPRVALQGVTVVRGEGLLPVRVSFVRSDVSTYADSLSFFSDGVAFGSDGRSVEELPVKDVSEMVVRRLWRAGFLPGEMILDGSVRVIDSEDLDAHSLMSDDDWSDDIHARCSVSVLATGTLASSGQVVEGTFIVRGGEGRTLTIEAEELAVNGEEVEAEPVHLVFGI